MLALYERALIIHDEQVHSFFGHKQPEPKGPHAPEIHVNGDTA